MHFHNENAVFCQKFESDPYTCYISTPWSLDSPTKSTPKSYTYNYKAQQQKRVVCVPPEEIKRTTGRELLTEVDRNPKIEVAYERWQFTALLCHVSKWEL